MEQFKKQFYLIVCLILEKGLVAHLIHWFNFSLSQMYLCCVLCEINLHRKLKMYNAEANVHQVTAVFEVDMTVWCSLDLVR